MKKVLSLGLLCFVFLFAPSVSGQTLKAGYTSKTLFYLPFFAALKKGFYAA